MIAKRTYEMKNWRHWDDQLDGFARDFRRQFGFWPNLLLASSETHSKLDLAANSKANNIVGPDEKGKLKRKAAEVWATVSAFQTTDYTLEHCVDDRVPENCVSLIFDSNPDDDGEPVPEKDSPTENDSAINIAKRGKKRGIR